MELVSLGKRIEVWNNNQKFASITNKEIDRMRPFIRAEKDYIRRKQENSAMKNTRRKEFKNEKSHNQMQ